MAEIRVDTNGNPHYYNDDGNLIAELDEQVKNLSTRNLGCSLKPYIIPAFTTSNEFSDLNSIEAEIASHNPEGKKIHYSKFTFSDDQIPSEIAALGVEITRRPVFISVSKDAGGQLQYSAKARSWDPDENGNYTYDTIDNYNPSEDHFTGFASGDRKIKLEEQIFLYDDSVETELLQQFPQETLQENKKVDISHEIQHLQNKINIAKAHKDNSAPRCSLYDYLLMKIYDETFASFTPLLADIEVKKANPNYISPQYQWFYDTLSQQGKDINNISRQYVFKTLEQYWKKEYSGSYAQKDGPFFRHLEGFVKYNPWASYQVQDNSEDFKKALSAMLTYDGVDYSQFVDLSQDILSTYKNQLEYTLSDGTKKNWLQELEEMAREIRRKAAQYGIDEEIAVKLKDENTSFPLTTKKPFEPQELDMPQEEPVNEDQKDFYRTYFKSVADKNNLIYDEDENSPNYKVSLKEQSGAATHITINNNHDIVMKATDANGQPKVPDNARFDDIVKMAQQQGSTIINFGNISSNEYKARLYLACLKANMKMKNAPELNAEFLASIDQATKQSIFKKMHEPDRTRPAPKIAVENQAELETEMQQTSSLPANEYGQGTDNRLLCLLYWHESQGKNPPFTYYDAFKNETQELENLSNLPIVTTGIPLYSDGNDAATYHQLLEDTIKLMQQNFEQKGKPEIVKIPLGVKMGNVGHNNLLILEKSAEGKLSKATVLDQMGNPNDTCPEYMQKITEILNRSGITEIRSNTQPLIPQGQHNRNDCATVVSCLIHSDKTSDELMQTQFSTTEIDNRHALDQGIIQCGYENFLIKDSYAKVKGKLDDLHNKDDKKQKISDDYVSRVKEYNQQHRAEMESATTTR